MTEQQDMVERVAFGIIKGSAGLRAAEHAKEFQTGNWYDALRSARAALAELRKPTAVMIEAMKREIGPLKAMWQAAVDAALNEVDRNSDTPPDAAPQPRDSPSATHA